MNDVAPSKRGVAMVLYETPANTFVAQFIGSPKMNFFATETIPAAARKALGVEAKNGATVGLRPEHMTQIALKDAAVVGTLEMVEKLGEYAQCHLSTAEGAEFIAKTEQPPKQASGEKIGSTCKPALVLQFNAESGLRL